MALDPSIYNQSGRVNLGAGLSDILDQQRQRDAQRMQQENSLASLAMQQQQMQQKQTQQRGQELNMWLSGAVQSGRPQDEVMQEAIAKGLEIGVAPEVTQRHVQSVFSSAQAPQARSDFAFAQAYPELVAKQRAESMFAQPKAERTRTVPVIGPNGQPILVREEEAVGMQPYKPVAPVSDIAQQRLELERQKFEYEKTKPKNAVKLSPGAEKELFEAEDIANSSENVIGALNEALKLNDTAYSGYAAKARAVARSNLPGEDKGANDTIALDNLMTSQALESLKATFGGMPTEGERKILMDMQASADKTPAQRKEIIDRAIVAAKRRKQKSLEKADKLRKGEYFTPQEATQDEGWSDL